MKIALAQINPMVGDLQGNYLLAEQAMMSAEADLVVFPEMSVTGYPPKDLLEKPAFVAAAMEYAAKWASLTQGGKAMVFGGVEPTGWKKVGSPAKPLQNMAYLAMDGKIAQSRAKTLLPTYDVFDEGRYFEPASANNPMSIKGLKLGVSICEDCWNDKDFWTDRLYQVDPIQNLVTGGSDILINISASPFALGKPEVRAKMLSSIAKKYSKPLLYVNQVGGNDDVVYDGRSMVFDSQGRLREWLPAFKDGILYCNADELRDQDFVTAWQEQGDGQAIPAAYATSETKEIYDALVMGTRDYARKTGFKKAILGLSGGIDSALVAVIAAEAFGPENVLGVALPSKYSSDHSISDARGIAEKLGIEFAIMPIKPAHSAYVDVLGQRLPSGPDKVHLWEENIQARTRGAILMAISNHENRLLLSTGNKSEVAVGYCTIYGDACGGLSVIADVFKTKVYRISKWINETRKSEIIPCNSIEKPPSAELRPNQKDQDSLPPYPSLDLILDLYVERGMEADEILEYIRTKDDLPVDAVADGIVTIAESAQKRLINDIIKKVDRAEYKRKQMPPGLKITKKAFGVGRQMPIVQGWH